MDILGQSAFIVAVLSFALGFSTLSRNVRNKLFLGFAVVCTLLSAWAIFFFIDKIWPDRGYYRLHLFFNVWLGPATLGFTRSMIRIRSKLSRFFLGTSFVVAVALSVALALHLDRSSVVLQLIYYSPGIIIMQILQLMWIDRDLAGRAQRDFKAPVVGFDKRNLIYLGGLVVLVTSVMDHVPWIWKGIPVFGNLLLILYLFFISQAITQQRLLNFGALFSRFLVLIAVALSLTAVYSLMVAWIEHSPGLFFLNSFIASFFILMLLDPLRSMVRYFTEILSTQRHIKLQQVLRDAKGRLTGLLDSAPLFQEILSTVEQTLKPQGVALFVLQKGGAKYSRVATQGHFEPGKAGPLLEIFTGNALLEYTIHLQKRAELPVILDQVLENEIERSASRIQREDLGRLVSELKALGGNLLIPLFHHAQADKALGFVVLDIPNPPEAWGNNWGLLEIIYPYFQQAAEILKNLEIYVRQREIERLAALGEMAAGLAHEIRNPLGAIKGAAQFLDPSANRPESRFLSVIVEEVDRLNRVVTQFLDYSKPATRDFKSLDASALTERAIELLKPGVPVGIDLSFSPSPIPAMVVVSAEQIQQVLLNLIQNSFKSLESRDSEKRGTVHVRVQVEPSSEVTILVEDNGSGIKPENMSKLFIPFFTTSPSGTGLGLSICQKIIEAHDGRLDVQSEEKSFARFSVVLPYRLQGDTQKAKG